MQIFHRPVTDFVMLSRHHDEFILGCRDQKQLISWFWKHKPAMVREIVCEECPEHGEMTDKPYISEENINDLRGIAASMHRIGVIKNNTIDDCISELITYWMRDDV